MASVVVCPACSTENEPEARFCEECGGSLTLACPSCGAEHAPGKKFCNRCGAPLGATAPAPAPVSPPEDPAEAGSAEMRVVSVLFVDLVGYTSLSESRDAEDVRELLGRYFDSARTIVERYGGVVEKFIGDAVMAVWGTPVTHEDDAERAVRAALEIVDAVVGFGEEVGAPQLRARAGVVTGQVAAMVNPGEGLVVGDRVNTASRVQSVADPGTVFVDEITRQVTSAAVAYQDAGEHAVRGKSEPLHLWRALRVVAGIAGSQREEAGEAPFVGRDSELRLVKELFHAGVDRKAARLVAVSGPAGVGKTRLRWEFFKYVDGLANTVLWHSGRCLSYGEGVAYWALAEMVSQRLGIPEEASAAETEEKLAAGLERWVVDPAEREFLAPRLGALLGIAEPGLGREELFAGWRLFFERLADHEPVALIFEDLQWADEGLLAFIGHVLDWSAERPIFILTFARPELAERREGWPAEHRGATQLSLEPLADTTMGELLDGLATLPAEARERIVSQAEGIPLYATETICALTDRGVLASRDGALVLAGELGELDVPASLSSLLAARLDALEPEERELVKAMSVFGGGFPRSAAAALSEVPDERLDAVLASLVRKQVLAIRADPLSPDRGQYGFGQTLLRTVAYEMLSKRERKPRHLAAAEHLRSVFPNDGEDVAEVIAAHYLDAYRAAAEEADAEDLRVQAVAALRRGAERALTVGAPEVAERVYRTAIDLAADETERLELTEAAGVMASSAGRYAAALELFEATVKGHREAGREREAARLTTSVGRELGRLGRFREAIERIRPALELLGPDSRDADVAALSVQLGVAHMFSGDPEEGAEPIECGLILAQELELPEVLAQGLSMKGILCAIRGRAEESSILFEGAIAFARRHALSFEMMLAQANSADTLMRYDMPGAAERCRESMASAARIGQRAFQSIAAANLVNVLWLAGRWDEVEEVAGELLGATAGEPPDVEYIHQELVHLHAMRGEVAAAEAHLAALGAWEASDNAEARWLYEARQATVSLAAGHPEEALERLVSTLREAIPAEGAAGMSVRGGLPYAIDAALALGRLDDAAQAIVLVGDMPPGTIPPFMRAQLARARGLLAAARGEADDVEPELGEAIDRFRALGHVYWLARSQTDLAAWLIDQGRAEEAASPLEDAIATFERLRAAPALERARELLAGGGGVSSAVSL